MSIADLQVASKSFAIDASMSAEDINNTVAKLALAVQKVADSCTAEVTTGDACDQAQTRADTLEGIVSELENIDVEVDSECAACDGEGMVDCPKCNGTGEIDNPTVTNDTVLEVTRAVLDAMQQLPSM